MNDLAEQYVTRHRIMQQDLHNLRAQRSQATTEAERKRCEAMIQAKLAELLTLREEAQVEAGVML